MNTYLTGALVTVSTQTGPFSDSTGTPVDPSVVTLAIRDPTGTVTTYTYGSSGINRVSTGIYTYNVDTTGLPGRFEYKWVGTGDCQALDIEQFLSSPTPF